MPEFFKRYFLCLEIKASEELSWTPGINAFLRRGITGFDLLVE